MLHFFNPPEEFQYLTRDDPSAYAPPPSFGPFRVLHQVGAGVLGPVFRTYEPTRDRLVAVKVFRLDITPEQAQSLAEALSMAAEAGLFHPSIVEPIAAGIEGTVAYRAEEYVAAESLDVALRHYAPAAADKILPLITQLAGAIDFARTAGIGHGALHPRDIFVTPEEARATGFGVVEALERVGLRAPVRRPYSAPEHVAGAPWSTPADVFSLGVIAYELLTGRRPAGTGPDIGPLAGASVGEHVNAVFAVLGRAMDSDPHRRFQTALAFASALEGAARRGAVDTDDVIAAVDGTLLARSAAAESEAQDETDADLPLAAWVTDDEIDEAAHDLPPSPDIDEQAEPAEAERVEEEFRAAGGPGLDEEDAPRELEDPFDGEPVEALPLESTFREPERERFSDDFRVDTTEEPTQTHDLFGAAVAPVVPEVEPPVEIDEEAADEPVPVVSPTRTYSSVSESGPELEEPSRTAVLPVAVGVVLGLLIGFGAGYAVGTRNTTPAESARTEAAGPVAGAPTDAGGREYSEQSVGPQTPQQPPSEPPSIPAEAPGPAESAARPVAVATRGTITVTSSPSRAGVTVDGVWRGRTPLTLENLALRTYVVRVVQPEYAVAREEVTLTPDAATKTVSVELSRARAAAPREQPAATTGTLYVDSRPRGARVYLDGKMVGVTPLRLTRIATGPHAVRLELDDHRAWRTSTTIVGGRTARVSGSLERMQ